MSSSARILGLRLSLLALLCLTTGCARGDAALQYYVAFSGFPTYGVPSGTFPSYLERATLTWLNLVRHGASSFGADYVSAISDTSYKNMFVGSGWERSLALRWNLNLNRAARAHVYEYSNTSKCSTTSSWTMDCANSTGWVTRVGRFYSQQGTLFELYYSWARATDIRWPFYSVVEWMCGGGLTLGHTLDLTVDNCVADTATSARNFTSGPYTEVGCGLIPLTKGGLSTCDFAEGMDATASSYGNMYPRSQSPIASGAHVATTSTSQYIFVATYDYDVAVTSATVYVGGTAVAMTRKYGTSTSGTWVTTTATNASSSCVEYYFKFGSYYYPSSGVFYTYGMGDCTSDYSETGGAPSCSLSLPSTATDWNTCSSSTPNGKTCTLTCKSGYGAVAGTCSAGTWTTTPSCTAGSSSCSLSLSGTGVYGWGTCNATVASGSSCVFACYSGYSAVSGSCSAGAWTTSPSCSASGTASSCNTTLGTGATGYGTCGTAAASGTVCTIDCSSGYTTTSGICYQGAWTSAPTCTVTSSTSCTLSGLPAGAATWGTCASSVSSGSSCYYVCWPGYSASQGICSTTTAQWISVPTCVAGSSTTTDSGQTVPGTSDTSSYQASTTSCTLTLPSSATGWGTCSATVSTGTSCSFKCQSGTTASSGTCKDGTWTTRPKCLYASAATTAGVSTYITASLVLAGLLLHHMF